MASRAERVENELVALLDWIERYFAVRDLLPPPAIAAGVASARAALALPADAPSQPAPEGAGEAVACLDCDAGHPRWVVPENGNVIHTLPGGMVNFCAAPSRPGGAA